MNQYFTYGIRVPEDPTQKEAVKQALEVLKPHATAMSMEDEMTVLDCIEQHPDFPDHIADEARQQAKEITSNAKETL